MFLSREAKSLLDANRIDELVQLPLERLLDEESLACIREGRIEFQASIDDAQATGPANARDGILLNTLVDPVVISSGHIYSRATIERHFSGHSQPKCPMANIPVQLDVMIPLPQISYAIAMWKFEQAIAAHAVAASPDLVPASQPLHSSTANLFSALNSSALNQPSQALSFAFLVGCNKLRLTLNGQHEALHAMLSYLFSEKDNNIGVGSYASYSAADWSFAWESRNGFTKLEMWFPKRGLTDAEVNMAIMATLQPLNLPPVNDDEPMAEISMQHIRDRAYVTAVPAMDLTQENAANCCIAFIKFARALRESHAPHGNFADAINRHHHTQVQRAVDLGVRAFGLTGVASTMHANPSATQSSRAVAASSQAPSQSMSHASILSTQRTGGF